MESDYLKKAIDDGYIKIDEVKNKISYTTRSGTTKTYTWNYGEEKVRAEFYSELIYKYLYEPQRIDLEVEVPRRTPNDRADIVVYEDDDGKSPYIVVECKKENISEAEQKQAIEQLFGNANSLRAKYAILVAGTLRIAFDVANYPPNEREKNVISDIPVRYGKVPKYIYRKGAPKVALGTIERELRKPSRQELLNKFQQCHDILWEGGKRNPAEAFDEMSKLMFCKIWDERWLTKKGEPYKFQIGTYETKREVAKRIREIYKKAQEVEPGVFTEPIKVSDALIYSVVRILQDISLSKADLDAKGEAFEQFLGKIFKGEMGQYFTPREIVRFMVSFLKPTEEDYIVDPACGSGGFLLEVLEVMRKKLFSELEERDAQDRWKDFASKQVWGIEINSQLARVAMMNMILHEDGHTNIENGDALDDPETWIKEGLRNNFGKKFTLLLTNPPFGAEIRRDEKHYLENYELGRGRRRQKTEILFIERSLEFLKPGGRMGIIVPDGILANSTLQYVRDYIMDKAQILAIISLPPGAFSYYGAGVKASILFLRKKKEGEILPKNYPIFMAEVNHIGYDTTGREDKNEFPEVLEEWEKFKEYYLNEDFTPKRELDTNIPFFRNSLQIFGIGRSQIEGRLDVTYYKPEYKKVYEELEKAPYKTVKLKEIADVVSGPFGSAIKVSDYRETGIPLIRISNIKGYTITWDENNPLVFISKELSNKLKSTQVMPGDIVVSQRGTLGEFALVPDTFKVWNISANLIAIKNIKCNSKYLLWYLSIFGKKLLERSVSGQVQPKITTFDVKELPVLLPPEDIQEKFVEMMETTQINKKKLEKKANEIKKSIYAYLFNKLGVRLPETKRETPIVYIMGSSSLLHTRWDVEYWRPMYVEIEKILRESKYETIKLEEIVKEIKKGKEVGSTNYIKEDGIPFIRVVDVSEFNINYNSEKRISKELYGKLKDKYQCKKGEILFTKDGTLSRAAIVTEQRPCIVSGGVIRLRFKEEDINPYYICAVLNSPLVKIQAEREAIGAVIKHLSIKKIRELLVPLPPKEIQDEIGNKIVELLETSEKIKENSQKMFESAINTFKQAILRGAVL